MVTLGKMCTATKGGQLTQGNIPLFYKSLQVTNFLSLIVLTPYLCTPPSLVTSALSHCVPVTGISSSSVPPVLFTDTLRHASMVPDTGWIHVQMVLLSHPHALPDTADEHGGTHACRHAQRHQLKLLATGLQGQTVPPQHPFKTDRITHDIPCCWWSGDTRMLLPDYAFITFTHLHSMNHPWQLDGAISRLAPETHPVQRTLLWASLWWQMENQLQQIFGLTLAGGRVKEKEPCEPETCWPFSLAERKEVTLELYQWLRVWLFFFHHFSHHSTEHKLNLISPFDTAQQIEMSNFLWLEKGAAGCQSALQHSTPDCVCWCGKEGNASLCLGLLLGWYIKNMLAFIPLL